MKTRNGFVSNSSSSSFIAVILPKNFDPKKVVNSDNAIGDQSLYEYLYTEYCEEDIKDEKKRLIKGLNTLIRKKILTTEDDDFDIFVIEELLRDFVVVKFNLGSGYDYTEIRVLDSKEVKKLLK